MLAAGIFMNFVAVLFVLVCIVLILVILIQKGRGGGLSGAFGGGSMAGSLLGSKTGDFLTWVTIVLVGVFLLLAVVLARFYRPNERDYGAAVTPAATTSTAGGGDAAAPADGGASDAGAPAELGTETAAPGSAEETPTPPAVPVEPNVAG
jgi:preprotein translocase subunit SecG